VMLWPRVAGAGVRPVLARTGLLAGVNALVILTAATAMNAQYGFFADWTDVAGALGATQPEKVITGGGSARAAAAAAVGAATTAAGVPVIPPPPPLGERVLRYTVVGTVSGVTSQVLIQLPRGYDEPANRARRYPVLETFQGYPGQPDAFIDGLSLADASDPLVASGALGDMIVVSPQTEIPGGTDSECVNGVPGYPQVETWLTTDVPTWLGHTFRVRPDRSSWATIGLSAGGWCAAMAAMLHPDRYSAAVVLGGYFAPELTTAYAPIPPHSPLLGRYDLIARARTNPPPVAIWLETSHSDRQSYPSSLAFFAAVRARAIRS
jgi:Putative esterase